MQPLHRQREDLVGGDRQVVGDQHLLAETDDEAPHSIGDLILAGEAFGELGRDLAIANDRARNQLREERDVEGHAQRALLRRRRVSIDIDDVSELFGNNTRGPDGLTSANGFLALQKYDDNSDHKITKIDPIFVELELWSDANRNGVADEGELRPLSDFGLTEIDLNYEEMFEKDKYHNETRQRSVIFRSLTDRPLLIFDIWFRSL